MKKLLLLPLITAVFQTVSQDQRSQHLVFQGNKVLVAYNEKFDGIYPICWFKELPLGCGYSDVEYFVALSDEEIVAYNSRKHGALYLAQVDDVVKRFSITYDLERLKYIRKDFVREKEQLYPIHNLKNLKTFYLEDSGEFNERPVRELKNHPINLNNLLLASCGMIVTAWFLYNSPMSQ